jgi:predicted esterase
MSLEGADPGTPAARPPVASRADIALAYQRFEGAFLDHRPEGQGLIDANLAFEAVTKSFFGMNFAAAISQLNERSLEMREQRAPTLAEKWLASLKVQVDPPIVVGSDLARVTLRPMYATDAAVPSEVKVTLDSGAEKRDFVVAMKKGPDGKISGEGELLSSGGPWQGTWRISISLANGITLGTGRTLQGVARDLDSLREENSARLAKLSPSALGLQRGIVTCRARNEHLKMKPGEALSTEFLADYNQLAPEIVHEVEELEKGIDPYARRRGDYWRVVARGNTKVPMRVYVPAKLDLEKSVPVVIALHGAGGDENMFMDAYGQGALKREADRVGFIAVSPATFFFTTRGDMLEPIIEDLGLCYPVDRQRVYVLGHSMGGGATTRLAMEKGSLIRAASCLAGFRGFPANAKIPPTYVVAAELDAIIPAVGIEAAAKKAQQDQLPVTFELVPHYGHTLVVEAKLGSVIDWMWKQ